MCAELFIGPGYNAVKLYLANYQIWKSVSSLRVGFFQTISDFKKKTKNKNQSINPLTTLSLFMWLFLSVVSYHSAGPRVAKLIFTALLRWLMHRPLYDLRGRKPVNMSLRLFYGSGKNFSNSTLCCPCYALHLMCEWLEFVRLDLAHQQVKFSFDSYSVTIFKLIKLQSNHI